MSLVLMESEARQLIELEFDMGDAAPKRQLPQVPFAVRQEIARQLWKMQEGMLSSRLTVRGLVSSF